jgi:hypothetical protein
MNVLQSFGAVKQNLRATGESFGAMTPGFRAGNSFFSTVLRSQCTRQQSCRTIPRSHRAGFLFPRAETSFHHTKKSFSCAKNSFLRAEKTLFFKELRLKPAGTTKNHPFSSRRQQNP